MAGPITTHRLGYIRYNFTPRFGDYGHTGPKGIYMGFLGSTKTTVINNYNGGFDYMNGYDYNNWMPIPPRRSRFDRFMYGFERVMTTVFPFLSGLMQARAAKDEEAKAAEQAKKMEQEEKRAYDALLKLEEAGTINNDKNAEATLKKLRELHPEWQIAQWEQEANDLDEKNKEEIKAQEEQRQTEQKNTKMLGLLEQQNRGETLDATKKQELDAWLEKHPDLKPETNNNGGSQAGQVGNDAKKQVTTASANTGNQTGNTGSSNTNSSSGNTSSIQKSSDTSQIKNSNSGGNIETKSTESSNKTQINNENIPPKIEVTDDMLNCDCSTINDNQDRITREYKRQGGKLYEIIDYKYDMKDSKNPKYTEIIHYNTKGEVTKFEKQYLNSDDKPVLLQEFDKNGKTTGFVNYKDGRESERMTARAISIKSRKT